MAERVPLVSYLELEPAPHLVAQQCKACGARYFDRRVACASCEGDVFEPVPVANQGELRAFTIVTFAAPGIPVPFVAGVVDCDGTTVRGNIVDIAPDPSAIHTGMRVELTTVPVGTDADGVEAIGYAYRPLKEGTTS